MKVLGVSGSPLKGGNTEILLDYVLDGARAAGAATEKIRLNDLSFKPCQDCGGCSQTGVCIVGDDMQTLYRAIESSDGIIVASPIFFGSLSAQTKAMVDRFHSAWVAKNMLGKEPMKKMRRNGAFLCTAGEDKEKYFADARTIVKMLFNTLNIEYYGELFAGGYNFKKETGKEERSFLENAFELGESLARSLKRQ